MILMMIRLSKREHSLNSF